MTALPLVFEAPLRGMPPRHLADLDRDQRRTDPAAMTDLPGPHRDWLVAALLPQLAAPLRHVGCDGGTTRKTLWRAADGALTESVLMRYPDRATVCISSQAGCGMACPFCATGQGGLTRNLSTAEIVDQVRAAAAAMRDGELPGGPGRLSNVVFMGMGEPLANYSRVLAAVRRITAAPPDGLGLAARSVTVSTVGLVPAIYRLAGEGLQITLAVSLHAPDDGLRDTLVPVNTRWKVAEVLDAARHYAEVTGRRVSIEYALIRQVNDQPWRAGLLGRLLHERLVSLGHVNLIPLNPTPGSVWDASPRSVQQEFAAQVRAAGVSCTVRDTRGREIAAACGQLAGRQH